MIIIKTKIHKQRFFVTRNDKAQYVVFFDGRPSYVNGRWSEYTGNGKKNAKYLIAMCPFLLKKHLGISLRGGKYSITQVELSAKRLKISE